MLLQWYFIKEWYYSYNKLNFDEIDKHIYMKLRTFIILFILAFVVLSIVYDNVYTKSLISGKYIYNYEQSLEGPHKGDYLILKDNGEFDSDTWGNGTYQVSGSRLKLN